MKAEWGKNSTGKLSVRTVSIILFSFLALWATLNLITLLSQLIGISFRYYFRISIVVFLAFLIITIVLLLRLFSKIGPGDNDLYILPGLIVLFSASALISLSYHTTGRLFLDDFYLTANPVYYSQHASSPMSFESRTFYSGGQPVTSIAFLTAGTYEYVLAIPAYIFHLEYLTVYYRFAAVLNSALLVMSIFLVLSQFSEDTGGALIGTFVVLCLLVTMSENSWAIGGLAFVHGYEGKSILIMDGIPLMLAYSLDFLRQRAFRTWSHLLILVTAMTGMSTSSLMLLPILGLVVFLAGTFTFRANFPTLRIWLKAAFYYLGAYTYLLIAGVFIALVDKPGNAHALNNAYPDQFSGYLNGFLTSSTWPATLLIAVFAFLAAVSTTRGSRRTFIACWLIISLVLALNPISAQVLLIPFRGIYFRLFYVVLYPLAMGIAAAAMLALVGNRSGKVWRLVCSGLLILTSAAAALLARSSIFRNPRYTLGNWAPTDDYPTARIIANITPAGVMLAPYPISGAIQMISSKYPQLTSRDDLLLFYLGLQGREQEANLRLNAQAFLGGQESGYQAFNKLIAQYPEIQSVLFSKAGLEQLDADSIEVFLKSKGFVHRQGLENYVEYWK